ncbi:tryptophan halogenase family protein [Sphingomicrobium lutaoense]|uniref:Tryptophan halogenase n=1 Tax=Sphingomicrobium lutaoense TaxID=515949 RepID=A0A839YZF5_9SPHN|nr:tryptophan halogenase family protein [Sphingomicrobium lutaoense]MBB3763147.1 tryptophan halogenase [Sphingomicrobium lutaoense]
MTEETEGPIRVVIAGGGTAGWMAAATLIKVMGRAVSIRLVESEGIGTVGVGEATIPQIRHLNRLFELDEAQFLQATNGSIKLGIEFLGWDRPDEAYMHAFGTAGRAIGVAPFRHAWRRGEALGMARPFGAYSFNEVAARALRYHPQAGGGAIPHLVHAYHFDAALYARMLRGLAEQGGAQRTEGRIETVDRDGETGDVQAILLDNGERIEGDLFIDCTGFRALLIGDTLGVGYEDWSHWLPCDRAWAVPSERAGPFRPYTQSIAHRAGWQWRIPLQHRTGNGHVFCSRFIAEEEARDILLANLEGQPQAEPRLIRFTTGRREAAWSHNVVALGLSAGFMEPLESTSIHLIQSGIERLLRFFPDRGDYRLRRDKFNSLTRFEWERIRDFLIGHYKFNRREGESFWDACRAMAVPDTLSEKRALFEESGTIHREGEELFTEEGWQQLFLGQGVMPRSWHPTVEPIDEAELQKLLDIIADAYAARAGKLPGHAEYLEKISPAKESA